MRSLFVLGIATACSSASLLPAPQAPPPLDLEVRGTIRPGGSLYISVEGLSPRERVWVAMSSGSAPGATCPANVPCIDLFNPTPIGSERADAQGKAVFQTGNLPWAWDHSGLVYLQAASVSGVSDVVEKLSLGGTPQLPVSVGYQLHRGRRGGFEGEVHRTWMSTGTYDVQCRLVADLYASSLAPLPLCPNCDYAYDLYTSPFREDGGDCASFLGVPVSQLPREEIALGVISAWPYTAYLHAGQGWIPTNYNYAYDYGYGGYDASNDRVVFSGDSWPYSPYYY